QPMQPTPAQTKMKPLPKMHLLSPADWLWPMKALVIVLALKMMGAQGRLRGYGLKKRSSANLWLGVMRGVLEILESLGAGMLRNRRAMGFTMNLRMSCCHTTVMMKIHRTALWIHRKQVVADHDLQKLQLRRESRIQTKYWIWLAH